jgi:hypothetical protein
MSRFDDYGIWELACGLALSGRFANCGEVETELASHHKGDLLPLLDEEKRATIDKLCAEARAEHRKSVESNAVTETAPSSLKMNKS